MAINISLSLSRDLSIHFFPSLTHSLSIENSLSFHQTMLCAEWRIIFFIQFFEETLSTIVFHFTSSSSLNISL